MRLALTAKDKKEQPCEKQREGIPDRRDSECQGPETGKGLTSQELVSSRAGVW